MTEAVIAGDTLEKVSGKSEDIIIPDEIKVIGEGAFEGNTDVKTVEIKNRKMQINKIQKRKPSSMPMKRS